jgi:tetratricopeptide (TPR) repeat protein
MIAGIGRVNDSLQELIAVAKTPAETWAYNQYEIARDAIRRELYPEAVEALRRAINGHGDHVGYKLEYRFHYTLGILYLGDTKNLDPEILDLAKAETSFLTAARYARADYPQEAGIAMTAADWSAFCQNKLAESESYTRQAIALHPSNGEAFYQLAKALIHCDRPNEAIPNLRRAAELDPNFTIKAATDPDFLRFENECKELVDVLRNKAECDAVPKVNEVGRLLKTLNDRRAGKVLETELNILRSAFAKMQANLSSNTFLGFLQANADAECAASLANRVLKEHLLHLESELNDNFHNLTGMRANLWPSVGKCDPVCLERTDALLKQADTLINDYEDYTRNEALLRNAIEELTLFLASRAERGKHSPAVPALSIGWISRNPPLEPRFHALDTSNELWDVVITSVRDHRKTAVAEALQRICPAIEPSFARFSVDCTKEHPQRVLRDNGAEALTAKRVLEQAGAIVELHPASEDVLGIDRRLGRKIGKFRAGDREKFLPA